MVCKTIRKGMECMFMTPNGCSYNGGGCHKIDEQCNGCNRTVKYSRSWYCTACPEPSIKWKNGNCNLASHVASAASTIVEPKINPLKAAKRKAAGEVVESA